MIQHAIYRFLPRLGQQFGITFQLTPNEVFETSGNVATGMFRAHCIALNNAFDFDDAMAGNRIRVDDDYDNMTPWLRKK